MNKEEQIRAGVYQVLDRFLELNGDTEWLDDSMDLEDAGIGKSSRWFVYLKNDFFAELQKQFGIVVPAIDADSVITIQDVINLVSKTLQEKRTSKTTEQSPEMAIIMEKLRALKDNNQTDEVISLLQKHSSPEYFSVFDLMLSKEYLRQERYQEALNLLKRSSTNLFPTQDYRAAAFLSFDKGRAEYALGLLSDARQDFLYASSIAKDVRYEDRELGIFGFIRDLSIDYFNRVDEEYRDGFLALPYFERKLLYVVKDYTDLTATHFSIFQVDRRPEITFPVGHPIPNQLYVGHPYTPNVYMPFDTYELTLVEDRIREFCLLSQFLGATEITIEALNTSQSESSKATNSGISGGGSYKIVSAGASINNQSSQKLLEAISKSISIHQEFTPYLPPSLPDGLLWYPSEPSWQRLYEQRMRGQDVHEERIETRKSQVVGGSELQEIKAEIKTLVLSVHGEWSSSLEESLTQQENAVLSIKVKFAPLSQLTGNQSQVSSMLSTSERDYLDEVKAVLEDGEIGPRERKSLERARVRLGISEARAAEIEASVSAPKLTDEEKEYLAEVKAILEDGEIGPRERKSLERTRNRLGISEERAKEIEKI